MTNRLETALKQYSQAKARLQLAQNRENEKRRKLEARAKFLLGGWMLDEARADPQVARQLCQVIAQFSERDRACFEDLNLLNLEEIPGSSLTSKSIAEESQ
ncbi:hypothetical protein ACQU0X_30160 [Pseudovibrio ascidiaceicola]|uniref:hypothetical protein n=1 Tax=Pseudovibrio ascidiaceicola TaxID=285279 RepID=UPI003D3677F7